MQSKEFGAVCAQLSIKAWKGLTQWVCVVCGCQAYKTNTQQNTKHTGGGGVNITTYCIMSLAVILCTHYWRKFPDAKTDRVCSPANVLAQSWRLWIQKGSAKILRENQAGEMSVEFGNGIDPSELVLGSATSKSHVHGKYRRKQLLDIFSSLHNSLLWCRLIFRDESTKITGEMCQLVQESTLSLAQIRL